MHFRAYENAIRVHRNRNMYKYTRAHEKSYSMSDFFSHFGKASIRFVHQLFKLSIETPWEAPALTKHMYCEIRSRTKVGPHGTY